MQWRRATRDSKRMQRVLSKPNFLADVPKEDEQKVVVVFRHRAHHIANEECHKILESLGLGRLHKTVLLKNTPETVALLKIVDPYVCYGYPNIQTVRDLIFKHGFLRINGKKTAISSNKLIEDHLGEHGCICIEDVVHDLFTVSDNFKNVRQMLIPFKVSGIWIIFFVYWITWMQWVIAIECIERFWCMIGVLFHPIFFSLVVRSKFAFLDFLISISIAFSAIFLLIFDLPTPLVPRCLPPFSLALSPVSPFFFS